MDSKPSVKLKTFTYYIKNQKQINIFDVMTRHSKNIYNTTIFVYKVYKLFEQDIYRDLYRYIIMNKLQNEEKQIKRKVGERKVYEQKIKDLQEVLYKIYFKYYDNYQENIKLYQKNTKIIYQFIKKYITVPITNSTYEHCFTYVVKLLKKNLVYNHKNYKLVFIGIVGKILKSFYDRNFFQTKYELINKKKIQIKDEYFINQVKNGDYLFGTETCKKMIKSRLNIELTTDFNIIGRVVGEILNKPTNSNYKKLPSDIIGNIVGKAYQTISAHKSAKYKGIKTNMPSYLKKDAKFNLFYFCRSFKTIGNKIRLTVGGNISKNYKEIQKDNRLVKINERDYCYDYKVSSKIKNKDDIKIGKSYVQSKDIIDAYYTYINYPKELRNYQISFIQIIPIDNKYKINITYKFGIQPKIITDEEICEMPIDEKLKASISIDLGVCNLMTIYNPTGRQKIINGGELISINEYYNHKISKIKSRIKKEQKKNTSKLIDKMYEKREHKINEHFRKIIGKINEIYKDKRIIIVGYNEKWKEGSNLRKDVNRKFQQIPYKRLLNKLESSLEGQGKRLIITEESYTSKCDALSMEPIMKQEEYKGKRIRRGLFKSSTGAYINADLNGAINIMRKYYKNEIKTIKGYKILNPTKIKINEPLIRKERNEIKVGKMAKVASLQC